MKRPKLDPEARQQWNAFRQRHLRDRDRIVEELLADNARLRAELERAPPRAKRATA